MPIIFFIDFIFYKFHLDMVYVGNIDIMLLLIASQPS